MIEEIGTFPTITHTDQMGRPTCDNKEGLKKGPWTPEEDEKLKAHIKKHGCESWKSVPQRAGLLRCGKSCRLRWFNYLRPGIRRGNFSLQEDQTIVQLHAVLGNKWSVIATYLDQRTDNEVKNHWNTHLKKRLLKMGIDPSTHKSITSAISGQSECTHKAQWESARLQAEARLKTNSYKLDFYLQYQSPYPSYTKATITPFDQHKAMSLSSAVPYANQVSHVVTSSNTDNGYENVGSSVAAPLDYNCSNLGVNTDPCSVDDIEDYWRNILDCINSLRDQPK